MKYFVFSIDDGTVFDKEVITLLNQYGFKATFNLNSGLQNFTWYFRDRIPISRLNLEENKHLYDGHEIASHSLTHPFLDQCDDERVAYEVGHDIYQLEQIFGREVVGFATPFHTCGDREVNIIKRWTKAKYIRLSQIDESFRFPEDNYHFRCTSITVDRALEMIEPFINDDEAELFISVFHSYDLFTTTSIEKLEQLLKILSEHRDSIEVVTFNELINKD